MYRHTGPRDTPNVGREHPVRDVLGCGLCRCGAHNIADDPFACDDCVDAIKAARQDD